MNNVVETIYNCETGEVTEIYSTPEYEEKMAKMLEKEQEIQAALIKEQEIIETKKQDILNKLGITEEEAKLLLS